MKATTQHEVAPKSVMRINVQHEITPERIADLFTNFVESGMSTFWCDGLFLKSHGGSAYRNKTEPGFPWYADPELYKSPDLKIEVVEDDGDGGPKKHLIGLAEIEKGFALAAIGPYAHHFQDFIKENDDANTADILLQLIVFKEEVYA